MKSSTRAPRNDTCGCMCYPNGVIAVLLAQLLLFAGFLFSTGVMLGCDFVIADIGHGNTSDYNSTVDDATFLSSFNGSTTRTEPTPRRLGFGFFNHQDANGVCHFEQMGRDYQYILNETDAGTVIIDYTVDYVDWLGPDWALSRDLGLAAASISFLLWIWLLFFTCISHPRPLRYILYTLIILVVMSLQFGTFSILNSEFCQERNCEISRTSQGSLVAGFLFLISGLLLCCTKNYPGQEVEASKTPRSEQDDETDVDEATTMEHAGPYSYQPSPETVAASNLSTSAQVY